jgi:hypothetical protein
MPTKEQGKKFREAVIEKGISLSSAVDFINENMKPDEVFDDVHLHQWAQENGYAKPMVEPKEADQLLAQ